MAWQWKHARKECCHAALTAFMSMASVRAGATAARMVGAADGSTRPVDDWRTRASDSIGVVDLDSEGVASAWRK